MEIRKVTDATMSNALHYKKHYANEKLISSLHL